MGTKSGDERDRHAAQVARTVRDALVSMDRLVWEVKPGHDTWPALMDFLAQYGSDLLEDTGIRLQLDVPLDPPRLPLTQAQQRHFLPLIQEALTNVLKHSGADRVELSVVCEEEGVRVVVCDNGRGFVAGADGVVGGEQDGLGNLRTRASAMGGVLEVVSQPGQGTLVRCRVPWT
jgi:signal transduction histidine kinase